jgi:4-amino-4-deoxy-L-arabinose transferase-like glycosyltransferase
VAVAIGCMVAVAALFSFRIWDGRGSLYNGDESIYAQMVREMRTTSLLDLRYDGRLVFQRPLLFPWLLCVSERLFGESELALRVPSVLAAGATAAATYLLGRRVGGRRAVGLWAVGLLGGLSIFVLYGRAVESDALLVALLSWSAYAWIRARGSAPSNRGWLFAYGALLGLALMTKQVIGLLALAAPLADGAARLVRRRHPTEADATPAPPAHGLRDLGYVLLAFSLVFAPWHAYEIMAHGRAFFRGYLGANVFARADAALEATPVYFYPFALWLRERWLALLLAAGVVFVVYRAARFREPGALLCCLWGLGSLVVLSASASRFDYYALVAYPPLAIGAAWLLCSIPWQRLAFAGELVLGVAVAYGLVLHTWPRLGVPAYSPEIAPLAQTAGALASSGEPLMVFDDLPFAARYYSGLTTYEVDLIQAEYDAHKDRYDRDLPGGELQVSPDRAVDFVKMFPVHLGIAPEATFEHVIHNAYVIGSSPGYVLFSNVPR